MIEESMEWTYDHLPLPLGWERCTNGDIVDEYGDQMLTESELMQCLEQYPDSSDEDDDDCIYLCPNLTPKASYYSSSDDESDDDDDSAEGRAASNNSSRPSNDTNSESSPSQRKKTPKYEYKYSFESIYDTLEQEKKQMGPKNYNKKYGIPKIEDIQHIFSDERSFRDWILEEHPDILKYPTQCTQCSSELSQPDARNIVRCQKCAYQRKHESHSIWKGSFFDGARKGKHEIMKFLYYWLCGATNKQLCIFLGWSTDKVNHWEKAIKDLIAETVMHDHQVVGGPGIVVEIDESKFGKRKYHKGHRVEGAWVFGGVENTPERRFFAVMVNDRKSKTLLPIIRSHIAPGSIIRSDYWKAYDCIPFTPGYDYVHEKVNHSDKDSPFVSPDGVCTNTIEGTWNAVKRTTPIRKRTKKQIQGCLFEFIWRRRNEGNLWNGLLRALEEIKYEGA